MRILYFPGKKKKRKNIRNETRIRLKTIRTIEKSTIRLKDIINLEISCLIDNKTPVTCHRRLFIFVGAREERRAAP